MNKADIFINNNKYIYMFYSKFFLWINVFFMIKNI